MFQHPSTNSVCRVFFEPHFQEQCRGFCGFERGVSDSIENNVGQCGRMWVSRELFPADFRREEKKKSDFRQADKENREGKVFERARVVKCQVLTYKHNNIGFLWITDVN